jgi:hypothetical protein
MKAVDPETRVRQIISLQKRIDEGYKWVCMNCWGVSRKKPQEWYNDGHVGRHVDMCRCGCDLFMSAEEMIAQLKQWQKEELNTLRWRLG